MDLSIGSSRRPSGALPALRFSMWSIILSTKYFLARSIFSPFLAEPEGESCVNSVTNIKSSVSSSVIPRSAEKKFSPILCGVFRVHILHFMPSNVTSCSPLTHFLHQLHEAVDKRDIFCGQDEIFASKPDAVFTIQKLAVFIVKIALTRFLVRCNEKFTNL